jgi:hypothetical protein
MRTSIQCSVFSIQRGKLAPGMAPSDLGAGFVAGGGPDAPKTLQCAAPARIFDGQTRNKGWKGSFRLGGRLGGWKYWRFLLCGDRLEGGRQ